MCVCGCFLCRTPLARPSVVVSGSGRWWGAEENTQTGCPGERLSEQTLQGQTRHHPVSLLHLSPPSVSECCPLVLCRVRLSTPATPAVTLYPVTRPAATATSAGSTEELEETEEAGVALVTQQTQTPTFSTRGGPMTAASTPRPSTTTLATETCPTASPTSPCTASPPTAAFRSCLWDGAAVGEKRGDENLRPSYQPQPIKTKDTGRGHSRLLAPVLIKWTLSNPG